MNLPFNASADRNKKPIGDALEAYFTTATTVLEIGSGTGQHAVYLKQRFGHLDWQCTDQPSCLGDLNKVLSVSSLGFSVPIAIEVGEAAGDNSLSVRLTGPYSFIYSANTAHIMSIGEVASMFQLVSQVIDADGYFALYGPFKINGEHTSVGNGDFDLSLQAQKPHMGIRDLEQLVELAAAQQLTLKEQISMPSNNQTLVWQPGAGVR